MSVVTVKGFDSPHGGFVTPDGHYLYLTAQIGNFITKVDLTSAPFYDSELIVLVPGQQASTSSAQNPHEAILSPDGSKYFVSCQSTNEVRVFQTSNDSLLAVIPVGDKPQEFDVSNVHPYVFVTCTEAIVSATKKGLVYVIDYNTNAVVTNIYPGYQPHGLAVDDSEGLVYIANLNYDNNGPAPHHVSACGNRNGYLTIIDMNNLQLWNKTQSDGVQYQYKNEMLSFPYFVSLRR
jgi:YVTN family beta-propeller protein